MSDPDKIIAPPGRRPELGGIIDEQPLPAPPEPEDVQSTRRKPVSPDDRRDGAGPAVPVSAGVPHDETTESPHDPAHAGQRPEQPGESADVPEVPTTPDEVPETPR